MTSLVEDFEKNNNYTLPEFMKQAIRFNELIHVNQLNDIKNQEYNHVSFVGNYTELLKRNFPQLNQENIVIENELNFVYLNKEISETKFKPIHTPYSFPCKYVDNLTNVFNGMMMINDYYILVNTNDDNLRFNVYTYTKGNTEQGDYYFFVLIGKIINPTAYTKDELSNFLTKHKISLSLELTDHLEKGLKIFFLEIDNIKKMYYLNLNGNDELYINLSKPFDKTDYQKFDLESYRKQLLEYWEKDFMKEFTDEDKLSLQGLREKIDLDTSNFLNGFMKIGTIDNQKFNFSELNQDLVLELYLLLNVNEEQKEQLEGTLWVYQLSDPGDSNNKDIHYLPIRKMFNLGKIYKLNKN